MDTIQIVVAIFLMVCSAALIAVVALQSNRGSEMSALTGSSRNSGKGQGAKKELLMKRLTIILGLVFVAVVVVMNIVAPNL